MALIEMMTAYPRTSVALLSAAVTLVSTLLMKYFTNQEHLKSLKERQKELQKEMKEHRKNGNVKAMEELNKEVMELTMRIMKASFNVKQILITFIPFLLLFNWIRGFYGGEEGAILSSWFWWYLGAAFVSSSVYRKMLKIA